MPGSTIPLRPFWCQAQAMRYESSVTSLSWIPSEAVEGTMRIPFDVGVGHYDDPPPGELTSLRELQSADRFRFANELRAWVEVSADGQITDAGYAGGGLMGATTLRLGALKYRFQAAKLADIQHPPEHGDGWVRFSQSVGGRTGSPMPRASSRKPFMLWFAPLVWTTLSLTLHADGHADFQLTGASPFPRHWVYDQRGQLAAKSGVTNWKDWIAQPFGTEHSPWGDEDSPALVTAVETALERSLSVQLMHGSQKPVIMHLPAGDFLVRQGETGFDLYLVLDGVIRVERDGEVLGECGPGALLGERAHLEGGVRTATLTAVTPCRIASVPAAQFELSALTELATGHRREEAAQGG
jgi:hypothetical protein